MSQGLTADLQAQERRLIDAVRAQSPERVVRAIPPDPDLILGRIGVTYLSPQRPQGYLRLYPQDFIVEEILSDGNIVTLGSKPVFEEAEDRRTLWADLVKACLSGPHSFTDLQDALGLEEGRIGYSGLKDAMAITSQRVTLRGVTKETAEGLQHERMFLRPVRYGSGALQPGELQGNRFTIVIRTAADNSIDEAMQAISRDGFLNFYGPQRFGPRLVAQRLGQYILQNNVDAALRLFFGEPGVFDVPLYRDVRLALAEAYGDWDAMLEVASNFPFSFRSEIKVLEALKKDPIKTRAALAVIKDQVKMWVYAYTSLLINRQLSAYAERGEKPPDQIAIPLPEQGPLPEYRDSMIKDGTQNYLQTLRFYPYLKPGTKTIPSRIVPSNLEWKKIPQGWVVRFALGKGAYATSCLSHAFRLYEGLPVPEWVPLEGIDSFKEIGDGNLDAIHQHFGSVLARRDQRNTEDSDTSEA